MTIDEAIENQRALALRSKRYVFAEDFEQIAEWLEELKDYRDKNKWLVRVDVENLDRVKTIVKAFVLACEEISNSGGGDLESIKKYFIEEAKEHDKHEDD